MTDDAPDSPDPQESARPRGRPLTDETYASMKRLAQGRLRDAPAADSVQTTHLVHEAWERLARKDDSWSSRSHFLAVASRAMWQILVDHARARAAGKRGGGRRRVSVGVTDLYEDTRAVDVADLADLLEKLAALDPVQYELVQLKCFGGLSMDEIGAALGISKWKAEDEWRHARAWLRTELTHRA